jgi:hypothetical protein
MFLARIFANCHTITTTASHLLFLTKEASSLANTVAAFLFFAFAIYKAWHEQAPDS